MALAGTLVNRKAPWRWERQEGSVPRASGSREAMQPQPVVCIAPAESAPSPRKAGWPVETSELNSNVIMDYSDIAQPNEARMQ